MEAAQLIEYGKQVFSRLLWDRTLNQFHQSVFVGVYIRRQQKRRTQESVDVIGITIVECSATKSSDKGRAICQVLMCIGVKPADDGVRAERQDNYINGLKFIGGRCDLYLWRCHDSSNSNWVYR